MCSSDTPPLRLRSAVGAAEATADGRASLDELSDEAVASLARRGLVVPADDRMARHRAYRATAAGTRRVHVVSGDELAGAVSAALSELVAPAPAEDADALVVSLGAPEDTLTRVTTLAVAGNAPVVAYAAGGSRLFLAVLRPPHTACPLCVALRLRATRPDPALGDLPIDVLLGTGGGGPWPSASASAGIIAHRALRAAGRAAPEAEPAELLELDLDSLERIKHPLLHTPLCPACREHIEAPAPPVLPGPHDEPADLSPALSADRMERALDPLTGIYAGVHVVAHDTTEPVSGQFTAWVTGGTDTRRFSPVRSGATGSATKRSEVSARVCAIGEGLERYSAGIYDRARFIRGSFDALGPMALDPRTLPLGSAAEYAAGAAGTPAPFAPDRELDWVVGGELATGRHRLVPAAAVYLPYRAPGPGERLLHPISTGWAAGSSLAQALRGGLLEVVERDAAAVFWLNRLRVPTVDWRQLPPGPARTQLDRMADQGIDVLVKDVTTDLGIPSVIALARFDTAAGPAALCGFRADVDDQACILGAVQELGQIVSAYLRRPEGGYTSETGDMRLLWAHATRYCHPDRVRLLDFMAEGPVRAPLPAATDGPVTDDAAAARWIVRRLAAAGHQPIAVDATPVDVAECGVTVVKAVVPGLQPLSFSPTFRYLGGPRLFEAPVRMGLLSEPLTEDSLNPHPLPIG
ncbi:TOMM precursor leader peptide-binding protein [Streptomyces sp. NPDC086010]|uniref:TOMM precursor leader peptide-binding protein n=1 Tax=Streptomyces sp. NPDC086010 TaxID=3365745 RepID=UPI0037CFEF5E